MNKKADLKYYIIKLIVKVLELTSVVGSTYINHFWFAKERFNGDAL